MTYSLSYSSPISWVISSSSQNIGPRRGGEPDIQARPAGFIDKKKGEEEIGLKDAGRFIGILERVMIVSFILIQQYALIGFLIAAKSVLRYSDIKTNYDRKRVEYILIGTLLSFSVAIVTGIVILWIIKNN